MQLGIWIEIRTGEDLPRLVDRVAALGFSALHAHFPAGCDEALARNLAGACAGGGLSIAAVSGYANPLRPAEAPMGATLAQLAALIAHMPRLDTRRLVSWSGTFGAGLLDDHPDNHGERGWDALRRSVDELLPLLDEHEAILLLEPYYTHVLGGVEPIARFFAELNAPYLGVVLDPPNLLPPDSWGDQAALIPAAVAALAPWVGLVHLKDMRLRDGELELPGPGQGVLDYGAFLGAVQAIGAAVPWIVEHVTLDQAAAARHYVLAHSREP